MRRATSAALLLLLARVATAASWEIDPAHSTIAFSVKHMTISSVRGEFQKFSGTVKADGAPTTAQVVATIDTSSIDTRQAKRDEHLRSPDFLEVAKYPTMTFKSTRIEPAGEGKFKVTGDLTLHGVTKPVVLDVEGPTPPVKDPMGKQRAGAHATTQINRKDFGIAFNKTIDGGGLLVGDVVDVTIDVEGVEQTAAP